MFKLSIGEIIGLSVFFIFGLMSFWWMREIDIINGALTSILENY